MPFYTYTCPNCGDTKTLLRKVADRDGHPMPRCGTPEDHCFTDWGGRQPYLDRDIAGPAFHLKGGGWEKDGYSG